MFFNFILSLFSRNCFEKQLMKPHLLRRLEADQLSPASNTGPKESHPDLHQCNWPMTLKLIHVFDDLSLMWTVFMYCILQH